MAFSSVVKIIRINLLCNFPSLLNLYRTSRSKYIGTMPKKKKSMMSSVEISLGILV